jgi:hypothetical protein
MKPGQIELVDEGVRVKRVISGENYYLYIAPSAMMITCPRENSDDMLDERKVVEEIARTVTMVRGGEHF